MCRLMLLLAVTVLAACAGSRPSRVAIRDIPPSKVGTLNALDVELEEVSFHRVPLMSALVLLQKAELESPQKFPRMTPSIRRDDFFTRKPDKSDNPEITLEMRNVTMRQVLDKISAQTGWPYQLLNGGLFVLFCPPTKPGM